MLDWLLKPSSKGQVTGKFNFCVVAEPEDIDSSSILSVTAYTNSDHKVTISADFRWFVIKNEIPILVPDFKGNTFQCQPSHIGHIVQCQIQVTLIPSQSNESDCPGTAIAHFRAVKTHPNLKRKIQTALTDQMCFLQCLIIKGSAQKECHIKVTADSISMSHNMSQTNFTFGYSLAEPRIDTNARQPQKVLISFGPRHQDQVRRFITALFPTDPTLQAPTITLKFNDRFVRDVFTLILRVYQTKNQLKADMVLKKIEQIDYGSDKNFDLLAECAALKTQLKKAGQSGHSSIQNEPISMRQISLDQGQSKVKQYTQFGSEKFPQSPTGISNSQITNSPKEDDFRSQTKMRQPETPYGVTVRVEQAMPRTNQVQILTPQSNISSHQVMIQNSSHNIYPNQNISAPINVHTQKISETNYNRLKTNLQLQSPQLHLQNFMDATERSNIQSLMDQISSKDSFRRKPDVVYQKTNSGHLISSPQQNKVQQVIKGGDISRGQRISSPNGSAILATQDLGYSISSYHTNNNVPAMPSAPGNYLELSDYNVPVGNVLEKINKLEKRHSGDQRDYAVLVHYNNSQDNKFLTQNKITGDESSGSGRSATSREKELKQLQGQLVALHRELNNKQNQINRLEIENIGLKDNLQSLRHQESKLLRRVQELQNEIDLYKNSQNALNRSQHLSLEIDSYNSDQISVLKSHNEMLTTENEKLVKACEKYMAEAKENNKLRIQIMQLKKKLSEKMIEDHSIMKNTPQ